MSTRPSSPTKTKGEYCEYYAITYFRFCSSFCYYISFVTFVTLRSFSNSIGIQISIGLDFVRFIYPKKETKNFNIFLFYLPHCTFSFFFFCYVFGAGDMNVFTQFSSSNILTDNVKFNECYCLCACDMNSHRLQFH